MMTRIFQNRFYFLVLLMILFSPIYVFAQDESCIYFFYGEGCSHCAGVERELEKLEAKLPIHIQRFEIYSNRENLLLLKEYFDAFEVPQSQRGVPAIFLSDKYFIGDGAMITILSSELTSGKIFQCPSLKPESIARHKGDSSPMMRLGTLSLFTFISAALVDSINPCAIAVLLILLGALLVCNDRKKVLATGMAFIASIYTAYFLFGLGILSALQITGLSYWFNKGIGFLAIVIGLANIKDYFWYGAGGFVMEIPRRWRPTLIAALKKVTSPLGAFLIGFIVCLFELPCTGGPYFFILSLLAERTTQLSAIPILLIYNLFFVLPLLLITLLIYYGRTNIETATKWKDLNIKRLHLIAGIIMLILGLIVVIWGV